MKSKFDSVFSLIEQDPDAGAYFNSLPGYVKDMIKQRAGSVNSFESLRHYAENLTQGDR